MVGQEAVDAVLPTVEPPQAEHVADGLGHRQVQRVSESGREEAEGDGRSQPGRLAVEALVLS